MSMSAIFLHRGIQWHSFVFFFFISDDYLSDCRYLYQGLWIIKKVQPLLPDCQYSSLMLRANIIYIYIYIYICITFNVILLRSQHAGSCSIADDVCVLKQKTLVFRRHVSVVTSVKMILCVTQIRVLFVHIAFYIYIYIYIYICKI